MPLQLPIDPIETEEESETAGMWGSVFGSGIFGMVGAGIISAIAAPAVVPLSTLAIGAGIGASIGGPLGGFVGAEEGKHKVMVEAPERPPPQQTWPSSTSVATRDPWKWEGAFEGSSQKDPYQNQLATDFRGMLRDGYFKEHMG